MKKFLLVAVMLAGCATAPPAPQRTVQLNLDGNAHGAEVKAKRENGKRIYLGKLPINSAVSFPVEPLEVSVDYDSARYDVSPSSSFKIGVSETSVTKYFTFTEVVPALKRDFTGYPLDVRRNLVQAINSFDTAINSPKFLFSSKVSEAKAKLDDLYVQYPQLQETKFFNYMKLMYLAFKASALVGADIKASDYLSVAKEATGQLAF